MFQKFHPFINFIYFVIAIGLAMFVMHPVMLGISFMAALSFRLIICENKVTFKYIITYIVVFLVAICINPLFSHQGITILFYFRSGNPCTLESIIYGLTAGSMLIVMLIWFSCINHVLTSDRIICLFGTIMPVISLIFSMVLRFVPRFRKQLTNIMDAQKGAGLYVQESKKRYKMMQGIHILSALTTWSLENSVDTADSMKARGYGTGKRGNYSIYRFTKQDGFILAAFTLMVALVILSIAAHKIYFSFYPYITCNNISTWGVFTYIIYAVMLFLPVILEIGDKIRWNYLKRNI